MPPLQAHLAQAGNPSVGRSESLFLLFPAQVDPASVRYAIAPAITLTPDWNGLTGLNLRHEPLVGNTEYAFSLIAGQAVDGRPLAPATWTFHTAPWSLLPLIVQH